MPAYIDLIADNLFDVRANGVPVLYAGRELTSGRLVFPMPSAAERFERIELPERGRLWSYTIQRFRPKSPPYAGEEAFAPYAVGYVALGEEIIVESRLVDIAFKDLRIDMPLRLTAEPFRLATGETRLTYAFTQEGAA